MIPTKKKKKRNNRHSHIVDQGSTSVTHDDPGEYLLPVFPIDILVSPGVQVDHGSQP